MQGRGRCREGAAGADRALLQRAPHPGGVLARHRLPGGHVPAVRGEHLHARRLLQLHAPAPYLQVSSPAL